MGWKCLAGLCIEYLYLHAGLLQETAKIIGQEIRKYNPSAIAAIESSILPLATLIAEELFMPLCIVRKPTHKVHEAREPLVFVNKSTRNCNVLLIDDAIWSGKTINHALNLLGGESMMPSRLFFIFDFVGMKGGGKFISKKFDRLLGSRISLVRYREFLDAAKKKGKLSEEGYQKSIKLFG